MSTFSIQLPHKYSSCHIVLSTESAPHSQQNSSARVSHVPTVSQLLQGESSGDTAQYCFVNQTIARGRLLALMAAKMTGPLTWPPPIPESSLSDALFELARDHFRWDRGKASAASSALMAGTLYPSALGDKVGKDHKKIPK